MKLAALVLAAGAARRFGGDKLSANFRERPLVAHAIAVARAAPVERVIVVCSGRLDIGDWTGGPPVEVLRIASTELSQSLKAGLSAVLETDGVFIFLGDMPLIPHDVAGSLAGLLDRNFAVVPRYAGRSGHPVLLSRRSFTEITRLTGDEGAGRLLKHREDVAYLEATDDAILLDVDEVGDIACLENHARTT